MAADENIQYDEETYNAAGEVAADDQWCCEHDGDTAGAAVYAPSVTDDPYFVHDDASV